MDLIEELQKDNEESFNKWFERWYVSRKFESKIKTSNKKGFKKYILRIDNCEDHYLRNRLFDDRTIEQLSEKLKGINVSKKREDKSTRFFGIDKKWVETYILFDWDEKE
ncbi:hypothetical protein P7H60_06335 [Vagococcus carniphilus]|uniref:hypothetical protein n=1 Tax=Vagococcus carniphilus TaxID=218144 RepID=UPI00288F88E8|nr:hypothetical protein [Vagococcus carniphilus]MDT2848774.1 hypothetical protein [Vagococcus carniphilus]